LNAFPAITVQTCEARASGEQPLPLIPEHDEQPHLFRLQDPFGVRKAIVALFWAGPDGDLEGLGSAFALDPWGHFATADHVIAEGRARGRLSRPAGTADWHVKMLGDECFVAILGFGLAFGTVGVPPSAVISITHAFSPCLSGNDPLKALDGSCDLRHIDLAILTTTRPEAGLVANLSIVSRPRSPKIGDIVAAIGFPEIQTFRGDTVAARTVIEEGMFVAYGQVTSLHPYGRDASNPTPVFEVTANWPPGMSGGPVFNAQGEVIGLVSKSLLPGSDKERGVGLATWLSPLTDLSTWIPSLDTNMPDWRRGWGVMQDNPLCLISVEPSLNDAEAAATRVGSGHTINQVTWRLGTDEFASHSAE
jgi:serine protease Do